MTKTNIFSLISFEHTEWIILFKLLAYERRRLQQNFIKFSSKILKIEPRGFRKPLKKNYSCGAQDINYQFDNIWNFDSFQNRRNSEDFLIFQVVKLWQFFNLPICKILKIPNLENSKIFCFGKLANFPNCHNWIMLKMIECSKLFDLKNSWFFKIYELQSWRKNSQFENLINFRSVFLIFVFIFQYL